MCNFVMKKEIVVLGLLIIAAIIYNIAALRDVSSIEVDINRLNAKLDSISVHNTDTIYLDVDDMSQIDWRTYTPNDTLHRR